jgi:hypothetical protein
MSKNVKRKPDPVCGWLLLSRDELESDWYIAWYEIFPTKSDALKFAGDNGWSQPYRAARGQIVVQP